MADPLFLTVRAAAEYLGCSRDELIAWVDPDRRLPGDAGPGTGARLWLRQTLDNAKNDVSVWRERDRAAAEKRRAQFVAEQDAVKARRKGMRKGGGMTAAKVREILGCSLAELNRWAADGRLPPDGEIFFALLPKSVNARAWLPATIEAAKASLDEWRAQDRAKKVFKRRGLRAVS
jgi:hypothetical protein